MKQFQFFVGIDVSKLKFDVCIRRSADPDWKCLSVFENTQKGIRQMMRWIKKCGVADHAQALFCLEHTGVYGIPLSCYFTEQKLAYCMLPGAVIRKSLGLKRGKNDKADAKDIARYAWLHHQEMPLYQLPEKQLIRLKVLLSHRERILKAKKMFEVPAAESKKYMDKSICGEMVKDSQSIVRQLERKLDKVDQLIGELITSDQQLNQTNLLLQSIPGVGTQIAAHMIVTTRCFTAFKCWRQFSCYAGVAPFDYQSGSSIHGKSKVSHLANKKMKSLLNMGALNSIKHDREMKNYYERKLAAGKNAMSVLNAVRNKLVSRMFAVINRGTPYVKLANYAA